MTRNEMSQLPRPLGLAVQADGRACPHTHEHPAQKSQSGLEK